MEHLLFMLDERIGETYLRFPLGFSDVLGEDFKGASVPHGSRYMWVHAILTCNTVCTKTAVYLRFSLRIILMVFGTIGAKLGNRARPL